MGEILAFCLMKTNERMNQGCRGKSIVWVAEIAADGISCRVSYTRAVTCAPAYVAYCTQLENQRKGQVKISMGAFAESAVQVFVFPPVPVLSPISILAVGPTSRELARVVGSLTSVLSP